MERLVRFKLLGQEYAFYTGASEAELEAVFSMVRTLIEENISGPQGSLPVSKVAILACLNIASRHVKLQQEYENYQSETEERLKRLNEMIRTRLFRD
ncbi:MAG: cell division protein ZapA [Desulfobulbaceae bacterium]|nr:MAG: cell division protein ZapA [Desulfobulbaceae bacterium]